MQYLKYIILCLGFATTVNAQQEIGLYSLNDLWQSNQLNPAFMPDSKLIISLPGLRNNLFLTGATLGDFLVESDTATFIDFNQAIAAMDDENILRNELQVETLSFMFRPGQGNFMISLGHKARVSAYALYPKALAQIAYQGNTQFIGQTIDVGTDFVFSSFNEFSLGLGYKTGKFTFGGKIKYLTGIENAQSDPNKNQATITTSDDVYQVTLNSNYQLNTAGAITYNGFDEIDVNFDPSSIDGALFSANNGFAFDIGVTYAASDKLTLSASILDIGSIEWSDGVTNYLSEGTFTYDGLDISDAISDGDDIDGFSGVLDTLQAIFMTRESNESYTMDLPRKIYLGAAYDVTDKMTVGGTYFTESFRGQTFQAIGASATFDATNFLTVGASYSTLLESEKHFNLGLNAVINLGPVQLFGVTDNIISLFQVDDAQVVNARFGVNVVFR